jgi:hypothetical protein
MSRFMAAVGTLCLIGWTMTTNAADLVDAVQLVSSSTNAANAQPPAQTFTVSDPGSYTVTLTDLQLPAALASLNLAIVNSTTAAVTMTAAGTQTVTLAAGTYTVQILATAAPGAVGGTFSAEVVPAVGGMALWQYESTVGPANAAPSTGQSAVSAQFTVNTAGTYQLAATDLAFPSALTSLSVGIFVHCGTTPGCTPTPIYTTSSPNTPPYSASLTLAVGTYDLFLVAKANASSLQGLYSVVISGGGGTLYGATQPVGNLPAATPITIGAAGSLTLDLVDLATPAALTSINAIVAENGVVLDQESSAGTSSFTATQGTALLYVAAQPGSGGQGAYEAYFTAGGQTVADIAAPVLATGSFGYAYSTTLASAGAYQVSVHDFQEPVALTALTAVTTQQGAPLGTTKTNNGDFNGAAGPLNVLVFPTVAPSAAEGLFAVTVTGPGSATAYQMTQGVGALFSSQTVTVTTSGTYNLNLNDFAFPASFSSLALIATSGNTLIGSIFSAGQLQLNFPSGTYALSVLAQVGPSTNYGLYGLSMDLAPPAPTVTLTASASSVTNGNSATLSWTSVNATSCTASGAWSGTLGTSGSQSTGALNTNSSFTITCTGGGGNTAQTVQVAVTPVSGSGGKTGGGGALSPEMLLLLGLLARARRRRAAGQ